MHTFYVGLAAMTYMWARNDVSAAKIRAICEAILQWCRYGSQSKTSVHACTVFQFHCVLLTSVTYFSRLLEKKELNALRFGGELGQFYLTTHEEIQREYKVIRERWPIYVLREMLFFITMLLKRT